MTRTDLQSLINSNLADLSNIIPSKHREVETALLNEIAPLYEVKELDIPDSQLATFISTYFPSYGLGVDSFSGWAICNGLNGTRNRGGRTSIGYDAIDYATLGATGGEETHLLIPNEIPEHTHIQSASTSPTGGFGGIGAEPTASGSALISSLSTGIAGGGLSHNNMQPYIVTLFIQRIA